MLYFQTEKKLLEASDCKACHSVDKKSIGPAYREVAAKYKSDNSAVEKLTKKVIAGGGGVWGETPMAAHPQLSAADASEMVKYILNIANEKPKEKSLPVKGTYVAKVPSGDKGKGIFIVRAAYEDAGAGGLPSVKSEQSFALRNSKVDVHGFDDYDNIMKVSNNGMNLAIASKAGAYMVLKQIDLNAISDLQLMAMAPKPQLNAAGGKVELRMDSPTGALLGTSDLLEPSEALDFKPTTLTIPVKNSDKSDAKLHDIYVVFVNPKAEEHSLMVVIGAEFKLAENTQP